MCNNILVLLGVVRGESMSIKPSEKFKIKYNEKDAAPIGRHLAILCHFIQTAKLQGNLVKLQIYSWVDGLTFFYQNDKIYIQFKKVQNAFS